MGELEEQIRTLSTEELVELHKLVTDELQARSEMFENYEDRMV